MIGLTSISNRRTNNAIDYCGLNFWKVLTSAENNNNNNIFFDVFIAILWRWCIFYLSHLVTKPTKWHVRPAKTQISPVWSESSLCAQWVAKDLSFLHADSEDWSDWVDAQAELCLRWAHSHIVGFVMRRLIFLSSSRWQSVWVYIHLMQILNADISYLQGVPKNRVPFHMSLIMRKHAYAICNQQRCRPACAPAQSDHTFVVRCLDSIISQISIAEISSL